jgi:hypothetical protein
MAAKLKPTKPVELIIALPEDRPIIGSDIVFMQEAKKMSLMDITWEFAWYNSRHNINTIDKQDEPLTDVTRAILTRIYAQRLNCHIPYVAPEGLLTYGLLPATPNFNDLHEAFIRMFEELDELGQLSDYLPKGMLVSDIKPTHSGVLIGFNGNSATRWIKENDGDMPGPCARRVATIVHADIAARGVQAMVDFLHHVNIEATTRAIPGGIKGLFTAEKWASSTFKRRGRPTVADKQSQLAQSQEAQRLGKNT